MNSSRAFKLQKTWTIPADRALVRWVTLIVNWRIVVEILVLVHLTGVVLKKVKTAAETKLPLRMCQSLVLKDSRNLLVVKKYLK